MSTWGTVTGSMTLNNIGPSLTFQEVTKDSTMDFSEVAKHNETLQQKTLDNQIQELNQIAKKNVHLPRGSEGKLKFRIFQTNPPNFVTNIAITITNSLRDVSGEEVLKQFVIWLEEVFGVDSLSKLRMGVHDAIFMVTADDLEQPYLVTYFADIGWTFGPMLEYDIWTNEIA